MNAHNLKILFIAIILTGALALLISVTGCENARNEPLLTEDCPELVCINGGSKMGSDPECYCDCPEGFSGEDCSLEAADCSEVECPEGQEPNPFNDCSCG